MRFKLTGLVAVAKRIANVVGDANANGNMISYFAIGIEPARPRTGVLAFSAYASSV